MYAPEHGNENVIDQTGTPVSTWSRQTEKMHKIISRMIISLSCHAAKNPKAYILVITLLSFMILFIGFITNFRIVLDENVVFAPFNSKPELHRIWYDDQNTGFPAKNREFLMLAHSDGSEVLTTDVFRGLFQAIDAVKATPGYDEICSEGDYFDPFDTNKKTCEIFSITRFWEYNITLFDETIQSDEDLFTFVSNLTYPDGSPVAYELLFGTPDIQESKALFSVISIPSTDQAMRFEMDALENIFALQNRLLDEGEQVKIETLAKHSFTVEFLRTIIKDLPLIPFVGFLMIAFTCLIFYKKHPVQSRCTLAVGSVITIMLSLVTGFGIMFLCGVPFTNFTLMIPFITMGIGLDDTFIITGEYFRTDSSKDPVERINKTMSAVGVSIFVTTFTTALAFALGLVSTIPGVFWLCLYAGPIIVIDFIYQITFFIAFLVLDERRIQSNRRDLLYCLTMANNNPTGADAQDEEGGKPIREETKQTTLVDRLMDWYATNLLRPSVKAAVLMIFFGWFVICAFRTPELTQKFDPTDLLPSDSYAKHFFDAHIKYNERSFPVRAFFRDVDQSDPIIQQQMKDYIDELVALKQFPEPEFCWVRDFERYWNDPLIAPFVKGKEFNEKVDFILNIQPLKEVYGRDIVRDESGNIIASACVLFAYDVGFDDANKQIELLKNQRAVSARQPINQGRKEWAFFAFDITFVVFEFLAIHFQELIATAITGVIAVSVVTFVFMPHWTAICFVFPLMIMLYVDLVGTIQIAGLDMNVVIYVGLVVSIGLLVDFIMHMLLRYYESSKLEREEKVKDALRNIGSPILLGGVSTFLGVVPMAFSTSAVLQDIYVVFLAIVVLGLTHGLMLLPVILSLVGPVDSFHGEQQQQQLEIVTSNITDAGEGVSEKASASSPTNESDDGVITEVYLPETCEIQIKNTNSFAPYTVTNVDFRKTTMAEF